MASYISYPFFTYFTSKKTAPAVFHCRGRFSDGYKFRSGCLCIRFSMCLFCDLNACFLSFSFQQSFVRSQLLSRYFDLCFRMDTLECFFADFLQRSGFNRDALQVCCFFKRTLADGLNVFADHNFFQFLIALECFVCDRSYLEGVFAVRTLNGCRNSKGCLLVISLNKCYRTTLCCRFCHLVSSVFVLDRSTFCRNIVGRSRVRCRVWCRVWCRFRLWFRLWFRVRFRCRINAFYKICSCRLQFCKYCIYFFSGSSVFLYNCLSCFQSCFICCIRACCVLCFLDAFCDSNLALYFFDCFFICYFYCCIQFDLVSIGLLTIFGGNDYLYNVIFIKWYYCYRCIVFCSCFYTCFVCSVYVYGITIQFACCKASYCCSVYFQITQFRCAVGCITVCACPDFSSVHLLLFCSSRGSVPDPAFSALPPSAFVYHRLSP